MHQLGKPVQAVKELEKPVFLKTFPISEGLDAALTDEISPKYWWL